MVCHRQLATGWGIRRPRGLSSPASYQLGGSGGRVVCHRQLATSWGIRRPRGLSSTASYQLGGSGGRVVCRRQEQIGRKGARQGPSWVGRKLKEEGVLEGVGGG